MHQQQGWWGKKETEGNGISVRNYRAEQGNSMQLQRYRYLLFREVRHCAPHLVYTSIDFTWQVLVTRLETSLGQLEQGTT